LDGKWQFDPAAESDVTQRPKRIVIGGEPFASQGGAFNNAAGAA